MGAPVGGQGLDQGRSQGAAAAPPLLPLEVQQYGRMHKES